MAQRTEVILIDDVDGSEGSATVEFSIDNNHYVIDLNSENADRIYESIGYWAGHARRKPVKVKSTSAPRKGSAETMAIRQWAVDQGYEMPQRGRLSKEIKQSYALAHPS